MKLPNFSTMSKRERIMGTIGVVIVMIVLTDRLVLSPWWNYIQKIRKENKRIEIQVTQQEALLDRKDQVMKEIHSYRDYLRAGETAEEEMAAFLTEVETLGKESKVSLQEIRPLRSVSNDLFREYGFEVHYECDLQQWASFVYLLEGSPSLYIVEKASIGVKEEGSSDLKGYLRLRKMVLKGESGLL